jgi:hypothetical protein
VNLTQEPRIRLDSTLAGGLLVRILPQHELRAASVRPPVKPREGVDPRRPALVVTDVDRMGDAPEAWEQPRDAHGPRRYAPRAAPLQALPESEGPVSVSRTPQRLRIKDPTDSVTFGVFDKQAGASLTQLGDQEAHA